MDPSPFERAFVAAAVLLGRREGVTRGLRGPSRAAEELAVRLVRGDRAARGAALALALAPLSGALAARRIA